MLAGVCAAFAVQYGWDLTVVRLVLVLVTLFTGLPVIAYLIAWVVIPAAQYMLPAATGGTSSSTASYTPVATPAATRTEPGPGSIIL